MEWICSTPLIDDLIHPDEKDALFSIQKSNFYMAMTQYCSDIAADMVSIPHMVLTGYPVTKESAPRIFRCYKKALSRLGCREEYPLYVDFGYELNGKIYGSDENGYHLVINSECGETLTDDELTAFLGGEIGHILAGHPQNYGLLDHLDVITKRIPFTGELVKSNIVGLFASWIIASEYTADRFALFAAENIDALISLRKKQMGFDTVETKHILNQAQREPPEDPGIYYVLMAQELPILGAVSRIQQLCHWVNTEDFAGRYTPLLYKLCLNSKELQIKHNESLLGRHRKAAENDVSQMEILGEAYLFGKMGLPQSAVTGESFLRQAAFRGSARAMFLEGGCLELGIAGNCKRPKHAKMLYRAAASRGIAGAGLKVSTEGRKNLPPQVISAAKELCKTAPVQYWISLSAKPIDKELIFTALSHFWVPINEAVLALDVGIAGDGLLGVIVTAGGIYGRLKENDFPFYISWPEYQELPLEQMEYDEKNCLYCGDFPFYFCKSNIRGTMAELFIKTKSKMNAY